MTGRKNKKWTISEINLIRTVYPYTLRKTLAAHFDVSETVMDATLRRFNIRKHVHPKRKTA